MGSVVRALSALAVIFGAALSALWAWTIGTFAPLAAVTALMMGGTGHPLLHPDTDEFVTEYLGAMGDNYVGPAVTRWSTPEDPHTLTGRVAVYSPEHFWPANGNQTFDDSVADGLTNLNSCIARTRCVHNSAVGDAPPADGMFVVFGYSQSARIATLAKRDLIAHYQPLDWAGAPQVAFVLIGNPGRPNGGVLQRFRGLYIPILGVTFDGATPTDSTNSAGEQQLLTIDIAKQYDPAADFPLYPLNLLATANALAGFFTEHDSYLESLDDPSVIDQGIHGDTHYYLIPTERLPILKLFNGIVPSPILTALDAPLRAIVELGYDRTLSPGTPARARLLRIPSVKDAVTVATAVPTGLDDGLAEAADDPMFRPLRTTPADGPFGVQRQAQSAREDADVAAEPQVVAEPEPPSEEPVSEKPQRRKLEKLEPRRLGKILRGELKAAKEEAAKEGTAAKEEAAAGKAAKEAPKEDASATETAATEPEAKDFGARSRGNRNWAHRNRGDDQPRRAERSLAS